MSVTERARGTVPLVGSRFHKAGTRRSPHPPNMSAFGPPLNLNAKGHDGTMFALTAEGGGMTTNSGTLLRAIMVALLALSVSGCEAIGAIFEAGVWVGVILVVIVVAVVGFIASKMRRGP